MGLQGFLAELTEVTFLVPDAVGLCALAATSSFLADTMLAMLLEDSRAPMVYSNLVQKMSWDVDYVHSLGRGASMHRWRCRHGSLPPPGGGLHVGLGPGGVLQVSHPGGTQPPWPVLQKGESEASDDLADSPCADDEILRKVWGLARQGYPRPVLEQGLNLLAQAGWSSAPVEQAHVAASMRMKKHTDYGQRTLTSRSMLASMAPLLKPSASETKLNALEMNIESLARRRPQHIWGRQVFLRELPMRTDDMRASGRTVAPDMHKRFNRAAVAHVA